MWNLLSLNYHVGFPRSLSEPHGGRFDADDAQRRPVEGRAATRYPAALKKLLVLYMRKTQNQQVKEQEKRHFNPTLKLLSSVDLGVSAGVDLGPAVGGHEAQDLRHLLEHVQTVDMDLETRVFVQHVVSSGRCFLTQLMRVRVCNACVATCVLSSSPRLVKRYSYPYAALQLSHTTW